MSAGRVTPTFNPEWEEKYFAIFEGSKSRCLVCGTRVSYRSHYNIRRHFTNAHAQEYGEEKLSGVAREKVLDRLKVNLQAKSESGNKTTVDRQNVLRASFKIANAIAKSSKPLSEGEFLKECLITAAEEICPDLVNSFKALSLSCRTVVRRIADIACNLEEQLRTKLEKQVYYSLALDECSDRKDTTQLAVFLKGVDEDFNISEEFLDLAPLKDRTTGENVLNAMLKIIENFNLPLENLVCVATDGAPSMIGHTSGFLGRLRGVLAEKGINPDDILHVHCFIHREALCAKSATLDTVMSVVVRIVNTIRSHSLRHRQFQEFLKDINSDFLDLPYHSQIRWLSRGNVLQRVFALRCEIDIVLKDQEIEFRELTTKEWVCDLAFLSDLTLHLNTLNTKLQGKDNLIIMMIDDLKAFMEKLRVWMYQIEHTDLYHFPNLKSVFVKGSPEVLKKHKIILEDLLEEFKIRFDDLKTMDTEWRLFNNPFAFNVEVAPHILQMELIDLQNNTPLRTLGLLGIELFRTLPKVKFPNLCLFGSRIVAMFGTTYCCEQFFSRLNNVKNASRSSLSDETLVHILRLQCSNVQPEYDEIMKKQDSAVQ